jgi:CDP-diacylglycerol pyrophosphatase
MWEITFAALWLPRGFALLIFRPRCFLATFLCFLLITGTLVSVRTASAESRDTLLNIVTDCLDIHASDYCSKCLSPRVESTCAKGRGCKETTEVWEETAAYVVIRDRKMCGCPKGFMHGLVIPRARIAGVEDSQRPDGIWRIAWDAALKRTGEETSTALVVNPARSRNQDQLHVHIVRLRSDIRRHLNERKIAYVQSLDEVWRVAAKKASAMNLKDYGVLVARQRGGEFLVLVEEGSPERLYTLWTCK